MGSDRNASARGEMRVGSGTDGPVTVLLQNAVSREPFTQHNGHSGSTFERVLLADGRRLVIKYASQEWDYIMRATADRGRAAQLVAAGLLAPVADVIDDAVLAVEPRGDGWMIAMRDVSEALINLETKTSRADSRRILQAAARLHQAYWRQRPNLDGLVRLEDRYVFNTPRLAARVRPGTPGAAFAAQAWARFEELAPAEIIRPLTAIANRPELLSRELERYETTLIHGDLKLENVGLTPDRVILLDWALVATAPPEVEFAPYVFTSAPRLAATPDEVLDDIRSALGEHFQPRALELALIGSLLQCGPILAIAASGAPASPATSRAQAHLAWSCQRVAQALAVWSPI